MSIPVTVLIYAGIPLAIIGGLYVAVFLPSEMKSPGRYRVGRPWLHQPSWYLPHQIAVDTKTAHAHTEAARANAPAAILDAPTARDTTPAGGASGEW